MKKRKNFFLVMGTLTIYSLNFPTYCTAVLTIVIKLDMTSPALLYHITGNLYLLITLPQPLLPLPHPPSISTNHKSVLFFCNFGFGVFLWVFGGSFWNLHISEILSLSNLFHLACLQDSSTFSQ